MTREDIPVLISGTCNAYTHNTYTLTHTHTDIYMHTHTCAHTQTQTQAHRHTNTHMMMILFLRMNVFLMKMNSRSSHAQHTIIEGSLQAQDASLISPLLLHLPDCSLTLCSEHGIFTRYNHILELASFQKHEPK